MTQQTPYIGSKISLISKLDIRYEGILYTVDSKESTIALSKVKSYGTEDRNAAHGVPPQDDVYDYIIFKANDIKDLIVCETPKPPAPAFSDPAIISQGPIVSQEKSTPAPVGSERSGSANATRSSTPRNNTRSPSQQQPQNWKNNDSKSNNSTYRQAGYQNRNNQNRQHGYEGNNKQQPRTYESQNRNGSNNYRQGNNQPNRNYDSQSRNTYNNQNNRGGPRNQNRGNGARPLGQRNNLKFENDYDFEKAYEQFKETLEAIVGDVQNVKIDDSHDNDASSVKSDEGRDESFYDKNKSFFDTISCEALEKEEGMNTRPDWRKERLTNQETFGQQSVRYFGYRRGGYNNRGGGGYNNRGGGYGNNRQQGYDNNRQGGYDNNRRGGYNNRGDNRRGGYDRYQQRDNSRQQIENKQT